MLRPRPLNVLVALGLLALLFAPLWRDREDAFFVIEPAETRAICAAVPGRVDAVLVRVGQKVGAGQPLLEMTSDTAASMRSAGLVQTRGARYRTFDAQVQGQSIGTGAADQFEAQRISGLADEAQSLLRLTAPSDGTVLTDNPESLTDQMVGYGQPLLQLAVGGHVARVFIPASELDRVSPNSDVALALPGQFSLLRLRLPRPSGDPVSLPGGIVATEKLKGLVLPVFYTSRIQLPEPEGDPVYGASGRAMIFGTRRSIAGRAWAAVLNLVKAHVW